MMLRLVIWSLRLTLSMLIFTVVTLLLGRGPMARRVLSATRLMRPMARAYVLECSRR